MPSNSADLNVLCLALVAGFGLAACSREAPPERLVDVAAPPGTRASFNMYRPGSTLDEWMALDVEAGSEVQSLVSIGYCDRAAARLSAGVADIVIFRGRFSVTAPHYFEDKPYGPSMVVVAKSLDRKPIPEELKSLVDAGFTVTSCPPNKDSSKL